MAIPDVDIHPSATGRAAEIVKDHENAKADIVLYSGWFCVGRHLDSSRTSLTELAAIRSARLDRS